MNTKSVNHYSVTGRPTTDAKTYNENSVARLSIAHNIGKEVLFIDAVMYANKGTKMERELPVEKLTKGNLLKFDGFLKPRKDKDGKAIAGKFEMVITKVSEPEVIAKNEPAEDEEAAETQEENKEA